MRAVPNMTIAVSQELYEIIKKHKEIKWSEIARQAIWEYARKLELLDELLKDSTITDEDVIEIGRNIKQGIARRHQD